MTGSPIDQSRAWEAYGHAMAAAAGLDLIMKVSNFHDRAMRLLGSGDKRNIEAKRAKLIDQAMAPHFSQSANEFYDAHPELHSDLFRTALDNAIIFRNSLSHRYFSTIWRFLDTDDGLDIIAFECNQYKEHFTGMETHIRQNVDATFLKFFNQPGQIQADIESHPVHKFLSGQAESIEQALTEVGYPPETSS